jgi:orotate phosphoribosyltransferase
MKSDEVLKILRDANAVITESHIVYTSGKHGSAYVNKDAVYPHTHETARLCEAIAAKFRHSNAEVVIAPAVGGCILSNRVAEYLSDITDREVLGVYAEREEQSLFKATVNTILDIFSIGPINVLKGEELAIKKDRLVLKRGHDKLVAGKNVLVVDDILTTGGSVKKVIAAVRALGGNVVGVGALCNRGGITAEQLDVPEFSALVDIPLDAWDEADCPLCKANVPINTEVGKGREFLSRKGQ